MNNAMIPLGDDEDGGDYINSRGIMRTNDEIISWVRENAPSPVEITVLENNISINWEYNLPGRTERGIIEPLDSLHKEIIEFRERFEEYVKNG